jgi:hypothetical protein
MKQTILILALAIMSISCSTGDDAAPNCNCGEVTESTSFNVVNGQGGVNVFSVIKIKNNCTGAIVQKQRDGNIPVGSQICNY